MKNSPKIWLAFAVCVLLLATVLTWIALRTVRMEQERDAALSKLEQGQIALTVEEKVNSAFWRIDSLMSMLISQESARDPADYSPFRNSGPVVRGSSETLQPSPLLESPSDLIRIHFQINPDGTVISPQSPQGSFCEQAVGFGVDAENIARCGSLLEEAKSLVSYDVACFECPSADKSEFVASKPWLNEQNRPLGNKQVETQNVPLWAVLPTESEAGNENGLQRPEGYRSGDPGRDMAQYAQSRSSVENDSRAKYSQSMALNATIDNAFNRDINSNNDVRVGMMRPVWLKDQLLLVRRVESVGKPVVQCCWLDWERLDQLLRNEIADLFPGAGFVAVTNVEDANPARTSTTLPIELVLPANSAEIDALAGQAQKAKGGLWPALLTAGATTLFASIALAVLLAGVMRLSERRATFVSAVSHELRTPLTTFRMYSEMLADGMVSDPQQREEYIQTLKTEAERLGHLVDNVLVYAGLENRSNKTSRQTTNVGDMLDRILPVLNRNVESSGAKLQLAIDEVVRNKQVHTDVQAVERVLVNLMDNAIKYGRNGLSSDVGFAARAVDHSIVLEVSDQGPGIPAEQLQKMFRAFSRSDSDSAGSVPGVGLGLALCKRIAADLGGRLVYHAGNPGSRFQLWLPV